MKSNNEDVASYIVVRDKNKLGYAIMKFDPGDARLGTTFGLCCNSAKDNVEVVRVGGYPYGLLGTAVGASKEVTDPQELINMCQTGEIPGELIDEFNARLDKIQEEIEAEKNAWTGESTKQKGKER